jgi:DNA-binding transcriptional LysR family regulator
MIDWDDVRHFLAVARRGSVRAAAGRLGVNHSTVLRRIAQLEERLGAHRFEKLPSGYRLTAAGEEVLELANQMETSSHQLETRVFGRNQSVRGLLRVTLTPPLAAHLLMPDFADFARLHPDIEMEILSSGELANLTNREAHVAIRVVYDRKTLPLNLHGLKGPELFGGVYISRDRLVAWRAGAPDPIRGIVISMQRMRRTRRMLPPCRKPPVPFSTYTAGQVTGHQKMELLMESEIQSGSDTDLMAFAEKTLPVVQGHLKMAQQLQAQDKS